MGCYARKAYLQYPNVRKVWDSNLKFYNEEPVEFFKEFDTWISKNKPSLFRMHSAGDIPDQNYWNLFVDVACRNDGTRFLIFTKRHLELDLSNYPENVSLVASAWPGIDLPIDVHDKYPVAYIDSDPRVDDLEYYFKCSGGCSECPGQICWNKLAPGIDIVFSFH